MSESDLIYKAKKGNKKAVEILYNEHFKSLYIFVRHKTDTDEDAEDIVGESFIKAFKYIEGFKENCTFKTWLYTIAKNIVYDHLRTKKKVVTDYDFENAREEESIKNKEESRKIQTEVKNILNKLNSNYKKVLELRFLLNCSIKETAEVMETTEGNVKVLQNRALKKARETLTLPSPKGRGKGVFTQPINEEIK